MTLAVRLPKDLQEFVERAVESGRFGSKSEVVLEALENFKTQAEFREFHQVRIKQQLTEGVDAVARGEVAAWDATAIKAKGRALLASAVAED